MKVRDIYDKILFKHGDRLHLESISRRSDFNGTLITYFLGFYTDVPERYMELDVNAIRAEMGSEAMIYTILIDDTE